MDVQDLIFADFAASNEGNKFTLVGAGFNNIHTRQMPCVHPLMFVLVRFKITRSDVGKNRIEVRLVGEKGVIFKSNFDIDVAPEHAEEQHIAMPIGLQRLRFDHAGTYTCEVLINGEPIKSHELRIIFHQQPQPQGQ